MVIYSVTVSVEASVANDWVRWMKHIHIPDVMATGCFTAYGFHQLMDPAPDDGTQTYNIQYACPDYNTLAHYREHFAPDLQAEHSSRYEGKFFAFRTVLQEVNA
jgi:hypothetical protein